MQREMANKRRPAPSKSYVEPGTYVESGYVEEAEATAAPTPNAARVSVDVRQAGVTRRVGSIPSLPRPPEQRRSGYIGNIPVSFQYLYGDVTSVLARSIEAASLLPGFRPIIQPASPPAFA